MITEDESPTTELTIISNECVTLRRRGNILTMTLHHKEDNPLDSKLLHAINDAFVEARRAIGEDYRDNGACLILTGNNRSMFSSGVPLNDETHNSNILRDAFGPLLITVLTFPFPTIALINGPCEGGACILSMCHDYRLLNDSGYMFFDAIHHGAHFVGIAAILQQKLSPRAARKMALEGHKFSASEALEHGLADEVSSAAQLGGTGAALALKVAILGSHGAYGLMRKELLGDTITKVLYSCQ